MDQLIPNYTGTQLLAAAVGIALVLFGRRLYWLALGGVGFFLGIWACSQFLDLGSTGLQLGVGFLLGVLGALLASAAQRVAVALGGFIIGGTIAYWTAWWLASILQWQTASWLWIVGIFGAMIGTFFAAILFDIALVALTSLIGALMVSHASQLGVPHESWLFLILVFVGMVAQGSGKKREQRDD
ncbi:MAG: DUF4203 domain-containing protein [bacterium]|nr:DUF4203 domain-containing protein [bacterium]